jgi:DNA (cytosine-5)-methyltransferase 1
MTHASLFSGIGGFDLAAEWMGWENLFHCEWNPFGQKVLKHHFPNSISYNDITKTDFSIHRGQVDILTGGFPCQPYSTAGLRKGKADERHLFPDMLRCIKEVKPRWIIGENVRGLVSWNGGMVFDEVCDDLEREGYEVQPFLIPAASVNAPHQRQRIWFVAYSNNNGTHTRFGQVQSENGEVPKWNNYAEFSNSNSSIDVTNSNCNIIQARQIEGILAKQSKQKQTRRFSNECLQNNWINFPTKPPICGGDDGISRELDNITFSKWRNESIKAYGNAIVPQVAHQIFKAIQEFELMVNK